MTQFIKQIFNLKSVLDEFLQKRTLLRNKEKTRIN